MLILSRRPGESLTFCEANRLHAQSLRAREIDMETEAIQVFVLGTVNGKVRLGIKAPASVPIRKTTVDMSIYRNRQSCSRW